MERPSIACLCQPSGLPEGLESHYNCVLRQPQDKINLGEAATAIPKDFVST